MADKMADAKNREKDFNVLLGVTGSVAAIKLPLLVEKLQQTPNVNIKVVATQNCFHFFDRTLISVDIYEDKDEWKLRRWADIFVIAPLDANTMGKISNGICDNLLTCVVRAWDIHKPLLYCPAMNTNMYQHPLTQEHLTKLGSLDYIEIPAISKTLACGDTGIGAMAEVSTIVETILQYQKLE